MKKILVLFMGGSLLLKWLREQDKLGYLENLTEIETFISELLTGLDTEVEFKTVCLKESTDLNADDFMNMVETIKASSANEILIVHGLSKAERSAQLIAEELPTFTKTIAFVGGTAPFCIKNSTAPAALGVAVSYLINESNRGGIFICKDCQVTRYNIKQKS